MFEMIDEIWTEVRGVDGGKKRIVITGVFPLSSSPFRSQCFTELLDILWIIDEGLTMTQIILDPGTDFYLGVVEPSSNHFFDEMIFLSLSL